jgi:hypothetical protein
MTRSALPVFPDVPQRWSLETWVDWARRTVQAITDQFSILRRDMEVSAEPRMLPPATVQQLTVDVPPLYRTQPEGRVVFCVDATGGPVPVYSGAGAWRRFSDNSVVS